MALSGPELATIMEPAGGGGTAARAGRRARQGGSPGGRARAAGRAVRGGGWVRAGAGRESVSVSPRPYNLGKRREPVEAARRQVLDAARQLLGGTAGYTAFTVDAVARQADVARATVYYQFGSKAGLLEALCDHLADLGGMSGLAAAFTEPEPRQALGVFVAAFGRFWAADRLAMRRLRALAQLDPDVGAVIAARDQRRRD